MSIVASRKSAALRVGVVTARVMSNVRLASAHASFTSTLFSACGSVVKSTTFSAMTWFVAMIGMPRLRASRVRPRPMMMCDWMCTTSGLTESSTRRAWCFDIHGKHECQPVVGVPAPRRQPVHRHGLLFDDLGEDAVPAVRRARRHDVHGVAAGDEPRGEALGEAGGAVHVRREGVGTDDDRQGGAAGVFSAGVVGRRGGSHECRAAYLCGGYAGACGRGRRCDAVCVRGDHAGLACGRAPTLPEPPASTRIRWRNAETAGRCRRDPLGARDGLARVQGRRHRKAAIGMLLAQVTGAPARPGPR